MDYKSTLNLPKTDFPMQGKLPQREPELLARWQELDLYQRLLQARADAPSFVLHDGPPYANGKIHIGHAVNKVLKDIINKSRLVEGMRVPYVPGWDCHGLPIEIQVEKTHGRPGEKLSAAAFRDACRAYAAEQIEGQKADFIRLGILGDWEHPYRTMDYAAEADILRELGKLTLKGQVYRGAKPVHWCVDCGSALAEAEVEYRDRSDPSIDVGFLVEDRADLCQRLGISLFDSEAEVVIWTTTPWTLPANQAVAVHPEYDYVLLQAGARVLLLAAELAEAALARYGHPDARRIATTRGQALEGLRLQHPFEPRTVPVILGKHVTLDAGTGCVHTAPAHGVDDYLAAEDYHLPIDSPLQGNGRYRDDLGDGLAGLSTAEANRAVPALLHERGRLLHQEKIEHSYPHCWRHKTPLLFRATPQWFIGMERNGLREQALQAIAETRWIPAWGEERIADMVRKRPDWCISRQRAWGVPVALYACAQCGEPLRDAEVFQRIGAAVEAGGVDAWFNGTDQDFLGDTPHHCASCGHEQFHKVSDILDVWFDSGSTHAFVLERRPELHSPADLYLEGADQHRGWFQSSLLESVASRGRAPYLAVLTHGFTVDGEGRKMSKSVGNVIAPQEIIDRYGADILRLWVASEDYRGEIPISDNILQRLGESYRRIRNTARYILGNTHDFDPRTDALPASELLEMDRWMLGRCAQVQQEIRSAYEQFQFHRVVQAMHNFCSIDLGGLYLDVLKDRLYTTQTQSRARRSAQTVLAQMLNALLVWMAPILSFTAEEIWRHLPWKNAESVFFACYPDFGAGQDADLDARWQRLLTLREAVNAALEPLRQEKKIGSALDAQVALSANADWLALLRPMAKELRFLLLCSDLQLRDLAADAEETLPGLQITVAAYDATKCPRCWHRRSDIGEHPEHPELCSRCVENVAGSGETREYC
ncbi:isoleucine--tRNA ligase [Acidithiobacillus sp. CV18-2]|uniref:Isoleucine--tRNA ligase n=1 Tax=Igneacidithiobacillus copahuensis TaxID=2724909 RepID=A0AAE2YP31_9PROT|nr:isoleucine--tRNA ligase [Igneacidithiobacillus copahuensis]MBU2754438.1 isoleucine--tRNA ligase [Acidithiobacillus sp. CV18-3]MBU2757539.1 isoleucine--tRNA ligase [Acidithiobacillus sp. BN09-2]MBU2778267.1 isoleucine--tRNA ligase [Acidithiobacillus sp. CV18-2]MBU2797459.1 isoleucine--tRNA ligase [Acidithiobacillus sp. VAN18-2]MBU2799703.1 isoleucine--tRNA ligase [Acidithiobacillus sp. VAN18-4]UTV81871.1 isoleucine--tRNA ligase [Acidithiobacillus sp. YTS05]